MNEKNEKLRQALRDNPQASASWNRSAGWLRWSSTAAMVLIAIPVVIFLLVVIGLAALLI